MRTRYKIILYCIGLVFLGLCLTSFYYAGIHPYAILAIPSVINQAFFVEGNGIICLDACGPCSAWGYQYILVNDQCVLPSVESCQLLEKPGDWEFDTWTCQPVCKEPYTDSCKQEMIMEKIQELEPCKEMGEGSIDLEPDLSPCYIDDSRNTKNPNECWYQDDDGSFTPCMMD